MKNCSPISRHGPKIASGIRQTEKIENKSRKKEGHAVFHKKQRNKARTKNGPRPPKLKQLNKEKPRPRQKKIQLETGQSMGHIQLANAVSKMPIERTEKR